MRQLLACLWMCLSMAVHYREDMVALRRPGGPEVQRPKHMKMVLSATLQSSSPRGNATKANKLNRIKYEPNDMAMAEGGHIHYELYKATTDWDCQQDPALEALVHTNGTRLLIYMFYHSNRTELIAKRYAFCKDWIVPVMLVPSKYMESQVYKALFKPNMDYLVQHFDFVLTCTYRHALKAADQDASHWVHSLTSDYLKDLLLSADRHQYDVVPLEITPRLPLLVSLHSAHGPNAIRAWNFLLIKMGFNIQQLDSCKFIMAFWRTSYLIRPRTLSRLTALMLKAQELVDNDKRCITVFKKDAKYTAGDPIVAYAIFGTAYYQLHPFVFERLPAFFLTAINASVPYLLHEEYRRPAFSRNVTTA